MPSIYFPVTRLLSLLPLLLLISYLQIYFQLNSAGASSADQRLGLPKASWVHFAEGNVTALVAQALDLARLADLVTGAKVERIERMMNTSLQHNEQILRKGSEALNRLTTEKEAQEEENATSRDITAWGWNPQIMQIGMFFLSLLYTNDMQI